MRLPSFAAALLAAVALPSVASAQQTASGQISCVLELYTSQGCSSCPPADQLLKSYLGRDDVLALSLNVDIWDRLGWPDTLAKHQFTERQRQYARSRGDGNVYTPQTVINGMAHAVGSDRAEIDQMIKATDAKKRSMAVALTFRPETGGLTLDAPAWLNASAAAVDATLWLVKFTPRIEVVIGRGENAGRTIAYHNVVRDLTAVGSWRGSAKSTALSRAALDGCTVGTCAVLLQQGGTGSILGAAWVPALAGI